MIYQELTHKVIGVCMEIHSALGPGLLESAYQECLFYKLKQNGLYVQKQKAMPIFYEDVKLDCGYRLDLLIENKIILEIKSVEVLHDVHLAQILTYLKLGNYKLGLLLNFNVAHLRDGLKRVINTEIS